MNKRFLKTLVLGAMTFGAAASFVGCKDYDKDINEINEKIAGLGTDSQKVKSELQQALNDLKAATEAAKANYEAAKKAADEAGVAAGKAQGTSDAAKKAADEALAKAKEALAKVEQLKNQMNGSVDVSKLQQQIDALKADLAKKADASTVQELIDLVGASQQYINILSAEATKLEAKVNGLIAKVDAAKEVSDAMRKDIDEVLAQVATFVGSRLTSISLISEHYVNGIPAIKLSTFEYLNQKEHNRKNPRARGYVLLNDHLINEEASKATDKVRTLGVNPNATQEVKFKISPNHLTASDLDFPYFDSYIGYNTEDLRAVRSELTGKNTPIRPVEGQTLDVKNGVLTLKVQRSVDENVDREITKRGLNSLDEKFYQVALSIPVAEKHLTEMEKKAGQKATITSELYRIKEVLDAPRIMSKIADAPAARSWNPETGLEDPRPLPNVYRPYVLDQKARPMHYSDSVLLYQSKRGELVDVTLHWAEEHDLLQYVGVCSEEGTHPNHSHIDYEQYGLEFQFAVAKEKYDLQPIGGNNKTNEQAFATIKGTKIRSRVYDIDEMNEAATGREPIIRITLVDKNNKNAIVDQRYMKIKWNNSVKPLDLGVVPVGAHEITCGYTNEFRLRTQAMNEKVYSQIGKYGVSKTTFHTVYPDFRIKGFKRNGVDVLNSLTHAKTAPADLDNVQDQEDIRVAYQPDPNETTSYNISWWMSPKAVDNVVGRPDRKGTYSVVLEFEPVAEKYPVLTLELTAEMTAPTQEFAYFDTYWGVNPKDKERAGTAEFRVNPIEYNSKADGPMSDLRGYSHISADLVNGFRFIKNGKEVKNLDQLIRKIRSCAVVKFVFDEKRFSGKDYLTGYHVSEDGVHLYRGAAAANSTNFVEVQGNHNLAASIENLLGATAGENDKATNLDFKKNEPIGNGADEAKAKIRLHEFDKEHGTDAAINLISRVKNQAGVKVKKLVPVNLVVAYNPYNVDPVIKFNVEFINPLEVNFGELDSFEDIEINGSYVGLENEKFSFMDYNGEPVISPASPADNTIPAALWRYYVVNPLKFDIDRTKVKTSLRFTNGVLAHVDSETNGELPENVRLWLVNWTNPLTPITKETKGNRGNFTVVAVNDPADAAEVDNAGALSTHIVYFNQKGTPVNRPYNIFVPVTTGYKWGTVNHKIKVPVKPAPGVVSVSASRK